MSRSYKHTPVYKGDKDRFAKKLANRRIRRRTKRNPYDSPTGKSNHYRKENESWDICDYRYWGEPIWREESCLNLRDYLNLWQNVIGENKKMHYVVSDIHNDYQKFCELLKVIKLSKEDKLFILGDLFDRSDYNPNPVDLYFKVMELGDNCFMIRGNHDEWLAAYIFKFYQIPEWKRRKTEPYQYNTFRCLTRRLVPVDVQNLAKKILTWPLQLSVQVNNEKYLLAHAMTSKPECTENKYYYLMGNEMNTEYLHNGIEGYISICGHRNTANHKIWKNEKGNLIMCDCGCGFRNGKLGCLCLETKEEFYV